MFDDIRELVDSSHKILIIQADNPDADSLGSALALEQLLGELGKQTYLYCGVTIPEYLKYMTGWDRVFDKIPSQFDLSIIVDTSAYDLLSKLQAGQNVRALHDKPCVVLDHHAETENDIPFADIVVNRPDASSTGELIYNIASELGWNIDSVSGANMLQAILGDTQGLTNESAHANTYRVVADLLENGVNRAELEDKRREFTKMDPRIFHYKAELIQRTEFHAEGMLAIVTIPQQEINDYSSLYNPAPLIQNDMLQTRGVLVAVVIKSYDDGRMLGSIRCNLSAPIASDLALPFGGGGHAHAAGFKITDGRTLQEAKTECIRTATELLNQLDRNRSDEAIRYTF